MLAIGIDEYTHPIARLDNAVNDARKIHGLFDEKCLRSGEKIKKYILVNEEATKKGICEKLESLKNEVKENDRLIFYYAGHGIALHSQQENTEPNEPNPDNTVQENSKSKPKNKPQGFLIPIDAKIGEAKETYLSMDDLLDLLSCIECRHCLIILDCCFAGSIQWSLLKTREMVLDKIYPSVLDNYIDKKAWFILTSSDENEKANDAIYEVNKEEQLTKQTRGSGVTSNSPFVQCLEKALIEGEADIYPKEKDGIITTAELEAYLSDVTNKTSNIDGIETRQTPQRFKFTGKHEGGEFVFLLKNFDEIKRKLPEDPDITADPKKNPYRGLEPFGKENHFGEKNQKYFFGRDKVTEQLLKHVSENQLTVVVGTSGAGKSSLVFAGLIPEFKEKFKSKSLLKDLNIVADMRPGQKPDDILKQKIEELYKLPEKTKRLLIIDQFEEIETQCRSERERKNFWKEFTKLLKEAASKNLHIVLTLRGDFEAIIRGKLESQIEADKAGSIDWVTARFIVPYMEREELQEAIEKPAKEMAVFFTSDLNNNRSLVQQLVNEVAGTPGALPLLSFALQTMYRNFAKRYIESKKLNQTIKREINWDDYKSLGGNGVPGSLTKRATEEYENLPDAASQKMLRRAMLRMVTLDSGRIARRRVFTSELEYYNFKNGNNRELCQEVINKFVEARLLVTGNFEDVNYQKQQKQQEQQEYVEPAHDALIFNWEQLQEWIKEEKENIILRDRVIPDVNDWQKLKEKEKPNNWQQYLLKFPGIVGDWLVEKIPVKGELKRLAKDKSADTTISENNSLPQSHNAIHHQETDEQAKNNSLFNQASTQKLTPQTRANKTGANNKKIEKSSDLLWANNPRIEVLGQQLGKLHAEKESWLNKKEADFVLQSLVEREKGRALRNSLAIAVIAGLSTLTGLALNAQRNALIEQVRTSRQSAEANLQAGRDLEALTDILRARNTLNHPLVKVGNSEAERKQVRGTLYKAIYGTRERNRLQLDRGIIHGVALHPTKDLLAIATNRGTIRLFDTTTTKTQLQQFPADLLNLGDAANSDVRAIAFTQDGKWLAVGGNTQIKFWKVDDNNKKINTSSPITVNAKDGVIDIAFNPNNNRVATVTRDNRVQLWRFEEKNRNLVSQSENFKPGDKINHEQRVSGVAFRRLTKNQGEQDQLVTVGISDKITLWNTANNQFHELNNIKTKQTNVYSIAFTQDGKLATGGEDKTVKLWEIKEQEKKTTIQPYKHFWKKEQEGFETPSNITYGMAFGASNKLVTFGEDYAVALFNNLGTIDKPIQPQDTYVNDAIARDIAYSLDGKLVAVIAGGRTIRLWDLASGKQVRQFPILTNKYKEYGDAISLAFSPNGNEFAVGTEKGHITLWDKFGQELDSVHPQWKVNEGVPGKDPQIPPNLKPTNKQAIQRIIFSPDGTKLAVLGESGELGYLSFKEQNTQRFKRSTVNNQEQLEFKQEQTELGNIKDLVFDSEFEQFLTIDKQNKQNFNIRFWKKDTQTPQQVKTKANSVAFSPNNQFFATAGDDGEVKVWNVKDLKPFLTFPTHHKNIRTIEFNPTNSNSLLTGGEDGTVRLWDISSNKPTQLLVEGKNLNLVALSSDGKQLATLGRENKENKLLMWEWEEGHGFKQKTILGTNLAKGKYIYIAFMPNSDRLVTVDKDSNVKLWDSEGKQFVQLDENETKQQQVKWVTWSKNGKVLATVGEVQIIGKKEKVETVKLWDFQYDKFKHENNKFRQRNLKNSQLEQFQKKPGITSLALSFDGNVLATAEPKPLTGRIKLWDTLEGNKISEFQTQQGIINSIAFSPNGERLVTVGGNPKGRKLRLWDKLGNPLALIQEDKINRAMFSYDGKLLAGVRDGDSQLMVWDVSGDKFNPLYGQKSDQKFGVKTFQFNANGQLATLEQNSKKVSLWQIEEEELLARACDSVREYLENNPNIADSDRKLCTNIKPDPVKQRTSVGDKILVTDNLNSFDKNMGVEAFANGDFDTAVKKLQAHLKTNPNDPEALIYLNNARIGNQSSYTIAISVPISSNVNGALEMLRGVAQAQNTINESEEGINGKKLQVIIADDENKPELAKQIAEKFGNNPSVLGVVGHYSSDSTLAASEIYNKEKLPAISPVSTSVKLSESNWSNLFGFGRYTFRTVPSDKEAAQQLAEYMRKKYPDSKAIIYYNSQSEYSKSLMNEFTDGIRNSNVYKEEDLSDTNFNAESIKKLPQGTVLVLMPDVDKLDKALEVVNANAKRQQRLPILAGDDVYSPKTLENKGSEGMVVAVPWHIGLRRQEPFVTGSVKLWGQRDVNWRTAMSYDATQALIAAIKQNPTREGVTQALRSNQLPTDNWATGKVRFSSGDRSEPSIQLVKVEPGSRSGSRYNFIPLRR